MQWPSAEYVIYAHLLACLVTMLRWAWLRPPAPARVAHARGLLRISGRWAYWVTRPMLRGIVLLHISPTGLTLIGLALGVLSAISCACQQWGWGGLFLLWSGICDLLDGELARSGHRTTPGGAFLDSVCDRLGEIAVFLGIAVSMPDRLMVLMAMAAMAASLIVSYTRARGEGLGMSCPGGGFERPGRLVVLMLSMILGTAVAPETVLTWVEAAVSAVAIGATGTSIMRTVALYHLLGTHVPAHIRTTPETAPRASAEDMGEHANLYRNVVRPQP